MATVPNPYQAQTPIGAAIANLGNAIFGSRLSPSEREKQRLETELLRAKVGNEEAELRQAQAIQRAQMAVRGLLGEAQRLSAGPLAPGPATADAALPRGLPTGTPAAAASQPAAVAANQTPAAIADPRLMESIQRDLAAQSFGFVQDPNDFRQAMLLLAANQPGATDADVIRAMAGAGNAVGVNDAVSQEGQTAIATRNLQNEILRRFTAPTEAEARGQAFQGLPLSRQQAATGPTLEESRGDLAQRVLEGETLPAQAQPILAGAGQPTVTVRDENGIPREVPRGVVMQAPGERVRPLSTYPEAIPPQAATAADLTKPDKVQARSMREELVANRRLKRSIDRARALAKPENFGITGFLRDTVQRAVGAGQELGRFLSDNSEEARRQILAARDVSPEVAQEWFDNFDPSLPQLDVMTNLIAYQAASALAQQEGRGLSDRDLAVFKGVVKRGGPLDRMEDFLARLTQIEQLADYNIAEVERAFGDTAQAAPTDAPASGAAPPVVRWTRDASGRPVPVQPQSP